MELFNLEKFDFFKFSYPKNVYNREVDAGFESLIFQEKNLTAHFNWNKRRHATDK